MTYISDVRRVAAVAVGLRVRSEGAAGFGNVAAETWAGATDVLAYAVYPGTPGVDFEAGRVASEIPMVVLAPSSSLGDAKARDKITFNGDTYMVEGDAERFDFGTNGHAPGVRVRMVRVEN